MPKGIPNKRYTPEFKKLVIETMMAEKLSYCETARQFEVSSDTRIKDWERIYLTESLIVIRYYLALQGAENGVTTMVTPFFCVQG